MEKLWQRQHENIFMFLKNNITLKILFCIFHCNHKRLLASNINHVDVDRGEFTKISIIYENNFEILFLDTCVSI